MLNPFPSLLNFAFFAPTVLRLAAALFLLAVAKKHWGGIADVKAAYGSFITRSAAEPVAWLSVLVELAAGLLLLAGFYTQYAAIAGAIIGLVSAVTRPHIFRPYGRGAGWLLAALCLSLLITGAGALAFDIPL